MARKKEQMYTADQMNDTWKDGESNGFRHGKEVAIKEMQADLRAKQADAKLKILQAMGQAMQANADCTRSLASLVDELRLGNS